MSTDEQLTDEIMAEAELDWIELGHALAVVASEERGIGELAALRRAGHLVARLLRERRLVAGGIGPGRGRFVPATEAPEDAAAMVERDVEDVVRGHKTFIPGEPFMFADATSSSIDWDASPG